jgi:hypothetical protein
MSEPTDVERFNQGMLETLNFLDGLERQHRKTVDSIGWERAVRVLALGLLHISDHAQLAQCMAVLVDKVVRYETQ